MSDLTPADGESAPEPESEPNPSGAADADADADAETGAAAEPVPATPEPATTAEPVPATPAPATSDEPIPTTPARATSDESVPTTAAPATVAAPATGPTAATVAAPRRNGTGRKIAVAILIVLSTIFVSTASVALWAQRTVFDTDAIVNATDSALDQPEVSAAISTYITDQIVSLTSQAKILEKVLPSSLDPLAPFIRGALTSRVAEQVQGLVDSQPGRNLLNNAVRVTHKSAVRLLEGNGLLSNSAFSVKDG